MPGAVDCIFCILVPVVPPFMATLYEALMGRYKKPGISKTVCGMTAIFLLTIPVIFRSAPRDTIKDLQDGLKLIKGADDTDRVISDTDPVRCSFRGVTVSLPEIFRVVVCGENKDQQVRNNIRTVVWEPGLAKITGSGISFMTSGCGWATTASIRS